MDNLLSRSLIFASLILIGGILFAAILWQNINILIYFTLLIAQLLLGYYVLLRDHKNEINFSFAALCFSLSLWTFMVFMLQNARQLSEVLFWGRYIYAGPILIAYFFLYFTYVFPKGAIPSFRMNKYLLWAPTLLMLVLISGPWVLKEASITPAGPVPSFGPAYSWFVIYFLFYFTHGIFNLTKKYLRATGVEKTQIRYIFLGIFLSFIFGAFTNLILPTLGISQFFSIGPFFSIFLIGFAAYAIIKHRLMSIEVVLQRGAIYLFLAALITSVYILSLIISQNLLSGASGWFVVSLAALVIALTYQPLYKILQQITDRIFFRGRYDYQQTLRHVSQAISTQIKIEELSRLMVSTFVETMGVSEISFMIYDKDRKRFRSVQVDLPQAGASRYKLIELDEQSPIVSWLKKNQDILVLDEIHSESILKDEIERLGVALWVPIISKEYLIGIITLGRKLSGDIYTYEDIDLLITLANQTALALENAALYGEVLAAKNYTQEILQSIALGVLTVDGRGQLFTFNPMAEDLTGLKITEVVGKPYTEVFSAKSSLNSLIEKTLSGRSVKNLETGIVSKSRGLVPVSVSTIPLIDPKGKRSGALVSFIDLTEVKALENKVRQADKVKALGTLAAGMAHEIKNPLSSMKVISQLLPIKYQDEEFRKKMMEILPKEIDRIDRIVESLLGFARSTVPKIESISIEEVLEDNLKYYQDQAEKNGVKIVRQYAALPKIQGDKDQLSQVFSNLILNAIQAMPEGGELKIVTREGKKTENILEAIQIDISDTGHGIPEENLKHLFDPFFTTKYAGTGLGLTITHSIIDGHRGYIDVKSEIGKGTAFTITLPVSQELL